VIRRASVAAAAAALSVVALAAAVAQASAPLTLEQRVLGPSEFAGFRPYGQHPVIRRANKWSGGNLPLADLQEHGFVAGVREQVHAKALKADGISVAAQFRTARGARAEVGSELAYFRMIASGYKPFRVSGIPGARGYTSTGGGFKGYNVAFSDGPFQYLVGTGFNPTAAKVPSKAQLVEAATKLYHRVHGDPAP
jgi:opacity protein-like surface antigen